jgi:hypothetical protein
MDVDLAADFPPEACERLARAIAAHGGWLPDETSADSPRDTRMLRFFLDGIQVDLLRAWDPEMLHLLSRAEERPCLGLLLRVPALVDLIVHKLRTGRPRDLDDAIRLVCANRRKLDLDTLGREIRRLRLLREWALVCDAAEVPPQTAKPLP